MDETYKNLLKKYNNYSCEKIPNRIFSDEYEKTTSFKLRGIIKKYNLKAIDKGKNDFFHITNIMKWVADTLKVGFKKEVYMPLESMNTNSILDVVLKNNKKANCWMHSIVLTECCLALGFMAKMVRCMPIGDDNIMGCHCVTHVYTKTYDKWVVMDAANSAYYLSEDMIPMNLLELKNSIIEDKKIYIP